MESVSDLVAQVDPKVVAGRRAILRRIVDFVAIPSAGYTSRLERAIAGDILLGMLMDADVPEKIACAKRLALATDAPRRLLRYLGHCAFEIAQPVLEQNTALNSADLIEITEHGSPEHLGAIARRRNLTAGVTQALIERGDIGSIRLVLQNQTSEISEQGMDAAVNLSSEHPELCPLLSRREELVPSQSLAMFWWSDEATRLRILQHQTGERVGLINSISDMFRQMSPAEFNDEAIKKALALIDRRQRNRQAMANSQFESLEALIDAAAVSGLSSELVQEMAYICNVKSIIMAKLLTDKGGEGLAVICKAVGLKRDYFRLLWQALRRPVEQEDGTPDPEFDRIMGVYLMLSVSKAQTALRYWNWSLGANFLPNSDAV